jgi:hypothetical protein
LGAIEPISFIPYGTPCCRLGSHTFYLFIWHPELPFGSTYPPPLFSLRTYSFVRVYAPTLFIWVYAPTLLFGFTHPPFYLGLGTHLFYLGLRTHHFQLGLCTHVCLGTMYPRLPSGLCTLICHWVYTPSFLFGVTTPVRLVYIPCMPVRLTHLLFGCRLVTSSVLIRPILFIPHAPTVCLFRPLCTHKFSPKFSTVSICLTFLHSYA